MLSLWRSKTLRPWLRPEYQLLTVILAPTFWCHWTNAAASPGGILISAVTSVILMRNVCIILTCSGARLRSRRIRFWQREQQQQLIIRRSALWVGFLWFERVVEELSKWNHVVGNRVIGWISSWKEEITRTFIQRTRKRLRVGDLLKSRSFWINK